MEELPTERTAIIIMTKGGRLIIILIKGLKDERESMGGRSLCSVEKDFREKDGMGSQTIKYRRENVNSSISDSQYKRRGFSICRRSAIKETRIVIRNQKSHQHK